MSITFQKAERKNIGLLIMLASGTGGGKTWSSLELATGMADGARIAMCDTERGRARMYADQFDFDVFDLGPPFRPERYLEVVAAAEENGYPVIVIDSMSHEWEGPGGLLEWHDELMGGSQSKNLSAWIEPKMAHRKFVNRLLQTNAHVIMCFRAAERVEVQQESGGRMKIVPKQSPTGLDGWLPITEKNLPFEATASFLLMAQNPGVPHPIKMPEPLKGIVALDKPLSAETGVALAQWAAGKSPTTSTRRNGRQSSKSAKLTTELLNLVEPLGPEKKAEVAEAIQRHRQGTSADPKRHEDWLAGQIQRVKAAKKQAADAQQALAGVGADS